jgi:hypothetical protein
MPLRIRAFLLCAFLLPALAQDAVPSAEALLRKAADPDKVQAAKNLKFTWREDEDHIPTDKNGKPQKPTHRTFESIMLEGDNYRKLVLIEGQPPDPKLQKKIDADLEKERAARKAHPQIGRHEVRFGGVEQILRMCDSKVAGEEEVNGRKAWRIESLPKSAYEPAGEEEKRLLAVKRVTWVDEQESAVLKSLEIFLHPAGGLEPGSEVELTYAKVAGAWMPAAMTLRYRMKLYGMVHGYGETRYRFYDYKKFEVESKIVE